MQKSHIPRYDVDKFYVVWSIRDVSSVLNNARQADSNILPHALEVQADRPVEVSSKLRVCEFFEVWWRLAFIVAIQLACTVYTHYVLAHIALVGAELAVRAQWRQRLAGLVSKGENVFSASSFCAFSLG